jgi:hypothetical protein
MMLPFVPPNGDAVKEIFLQMGSMTIEDDSNE